MQSPKKVAKYSGHKPGSAPDRLDNTLPPGGIPEPATSSDLEDDILHVQSLTPYNVLEKIRNDIISVIGIQGSIAGRYTPLEEKLVDFLEKIVRKGHCPSILVKQRDLIEAMLCLKSFFETESVAIKPDEANANASINVPVFPALYKYAKDAAFCEQRIRELRQQKSRTADNRQKQKMDAEIKQLRERKDNSLIYYQKIIFSDAEALTNRGTRRQLTLHGKNVSLDELIHFLKKGGRPDQAREARPNLPQPNQQSHDNSISFSGESLEDSLGSFDRTDTLDEVLDWRQIKSEGKKQPKKNDDNSHYSFKI